MARTFFLLSILLIPSLVAVGQSLEARLRPLVNEGLSRQSKSSVKIVELGSGRVVAAENADTPVIPASNLKVMTTAAALDLLGEDFEFETTLLARGTVSNGTLDGDIMVRGSGDPTIGGRFFDESSSTVLENLVVALRREGIERITGNAIVEYGYFDDRWVHPTWPEDQLVFWYEAPISAPAIQEGTVIVRVKPGSPGQKGIVELEPPNTFVTIENTSVTKRAGRGVYVGRKPGTNTIIVKGNVRPGDGPTQIPVTVMHPVHFFGNALHETLKSRGIDLQGQPILAREGPRGDWRVLEIVDTPLPIVIYVINKQSQNHYAEQTIKTLGAEKGGAGSWEAGGRVVEEWLAERVGVNPAQVSMADGSGMSRQNRASATAFVEVLEYMWNSENRIVFLTSMPYSGEKASRMRRRINQEPYKRNIYAKTGYIAKVVGLTGYVKATSGKVYAFSLLYNDFPTWTGPMYQLQNTILQTIVDHG